MRGEDKGTDASYETRRNNSRHDLRYNSKALRTLASALSSHAPSRRACATRGLCCWPPPPLDRSQKPLWSALPAQVWTQASRTADTPHTAASPTCSWAGSACACTCKTRRCPHANRICDQCIDVPATICPCVAEHKPWHGHYLHMQYHRSLRAEECRWVAHSQALRTLDNGACHQQQRCTSAHQ